MLFFIAASCFVKDESKIRFLVIFLFFLNK